MTHFQNAFKRQAKMQSEQITLPNMHWRHKDNGWEVVSTVLCNKWDNAVHPDEHDDFTTNTLGPDTPDNDCVRYSPDSPADWETFLTDESHMPVIFDKHAFNQFESAFHNDVDYMNAEETAAFLHDTFEAEYTFNGERYDNCNTCDGTGTVIAVENSRSYCRNDCGDSKHSTPRVTDDACSCTSSAYTDEMTECDDCNGDGKTLKTGFTRTFPYTRDTILSEMPSKRELQVLQFTLNRMANIAEENDTTVSFRKAMRLYETLETGDTDTLVSQAIEFIKPSFETVETPARDANGLIKTDDSGKPVMNEQPDPDAIEQTTVKLTAMLNSISESQAQAQIA